MIVRNKKKMQGCIKIQQKILIDTKMPTTEKKYENIFEIMIDIFLHRITEKWNDQF